MRRIPAARPGPATLLLLAGAAVQLVPLLVLPVFPSQDGAAHVDTAWVLLHRGDDDAVGALLREHYAVDLRPVPNLVSTLVLVPLVALFGADVAERVLVAAVGLALVGALAWALRGVTRRAGLLAVAALPFAGSHLVAFGFYNFCWGVVGTLLVLGLALRRRRGWSVGSVLGLTGLLLLTWSAHLLPFAVAALAVVALGTGRTRAAVPGERWSAARRHLLPVAVALLPAALLSLRYVLSSQAPVGGPADWPTLLRPLQLLIGLRPFTAGGYADWPMGLAIALALLALLVAAARTRPVPSTETRALGAVAVLVLVAYCLTPAQLGSGFGFLDQRLAWFPPLVAVLWAAGRLPARRVVGAVVLVLVVASSAAVVVRLPQQLAVARQTQVLLSVADQLDPASTLVVLQYADVGPVGGPDPLRHESSRLALRAQGVDVGHYEAALPYFQVRFTDGPDLRGRLDPGLDGLELRPPQVDLPAVRGDLDYVVVLGWDDATPAVRDAPASRAVMAELSAHYVRVPVPGSQRLLSLWRLDPSRST